VGSLFRFLFKYFYGARSVEAVIENTTKHMKTKYQFPSLIEKSSLIRPILRLIAFVATMKLVFFGHAQSAAFVMASTTTDFFSKCLPALRTNIATCGLMTVCDAVVPKPSELDTIFKDGTGYRVMKALFMHQLELNACEVVQSNLSKFLMANKVDLSKKLNVDNISTDLRRIRPYILAKRKGPINNNYWNVSGGTAAAASRWQVTVSSPTGIPAHAGWFNTGERVFIKGQTAGGTSTNTAWKVYTSVVAGNTVTLVLDRQNAGTFLSEDQIEDPVTGLLVRGTANVSDFESFCSRPPGLITTREDEFWIETTRDATCEDELYAQWRNLVFENNPLYAEMYDLTTIEYNRQSGEDFYRRLANTFFFNKALDNQTLETVADLEDIESTDPTGSRCVGKRANAIGIYEQHVQCNRVIDLQGQPININALAKAFYTMQRVRKDNGGKNTNIFEVFIPSQYFPNWNLAMLKYYKNQSAGMLELVQDVTKNTKEAPLGFVYRDYPLVWPNVTIRVITDEYFDDLLTAAQAAGLTTAGYQMWILDWSKNYMGVLESNRVVNKTGDLKALAATNNSYACVMRVPTKTTTLTSLTWTAIAECPAGDLILENFSGDEPNVSDTANEYGATTTTTTSTTTAA
jgi:hypothetical protein